MNDFFLNGGGTISNMEDLAKKLPAMDDRVFSFHANPAKNDFSNWIRDVFKQPELAKEIAKMDKRHMAKAIEEHVKKHSHNSMHHKIPILHHLTKH